MDQNIKEIAAIYMKSVEAGERFLNNPNSEDMEENANRFTEADEKLGGLVGVQGAELLALRNAVAQGNFSDAKARYAELTK